MAIKLPPLKSHKYLQVTNEQFSMLKEFLSKSNGMIFNRYTFLFKNDRIVHIIYVWK